MFRCMLGVIAVACSLLQIDVSRASDVHDKASGLKASVGSQTIVQDEAASPGEQKARKRLRQALRARELLHRSSLRAVFAVTERQAEEKLIQKLLQQEPAMSTSGNVTMADIGFCEDQYTQAEREALAVALVPLEVPVYRPTLSVTFAEDPVYRNRIHEEGHRIIQTVLGDQRYRTSYRQCRESRDLESQTHTARSNSMFYQFLGLNPEQQGVIADIVAESESQITPPVSEDDVELDLLDETGRIPRFREAELSADSDPAPQDEAVLAQLNAKIEREEAQFAERFLAVLTPKQREVMREYAAEYRFVVGSHALSAFLAGLEVESKE